MILKLLIKLIIWLVSIFVIGFLGLSLNFSNSITLFLLLIGLYFFGSYVYSIQNNNKIQAFFTFGGGIILYFIISILIHPYKWYLPPIFGLLFYYLGFTFKTKGIVFVAPVVLIYSFLVFPFFYCIRTSGDQDKIQQKFIDSNYTFFSNDLTPKVSLKNQVVLLETWNETCSSCLQAMKDLHPTLSRLENDQIKHYYLYVDYKKSDSLRFTKEDIDNYLEGKSEIILRRKIKQKVGNVPIIFEPMHFLLKSFNIPNSVPQFILILPNGKVRWLISGYDSKYSFMYKWYLSYVLNLK